ncbi:hypothetical protein LZC95_08620 [Pendulispora brunnea]|uniref:Uncharacterized protein n=1 Tax=Pendulispora brunnea TaxID=2905690 RepID=A0ABZ2KE86_9BACT
MEFVARIVTTIRNATFAEVAGLDTASLASHAAASGKPKRAPRAPAAQLLLTERAGSDKAQKAGAMFKESGTGTGLLDTAQGRRGRRPRQTQEKRGELAERIIRVLATAGSPLGVRALAGELSISPDLLALPLRELRDQGKIRKLGEKRNTTYSLQ